MPDALPLTGLTVLASLSPLLTFASLWQIKEWRVDRLREHLRNEGILRQLFGVSRPAFFAIFGILGILGLLPQWPLVTLLAFVTLNAIQMATHHQRAPVWTKKAIALIATSILMTTLASLGVATNSQFPIPNSQFPLVLLPLLQPFALFGSWLLWNPIDRFLKARVMSRALRLRFSPALKDATVVGITGSVGKTTTKELLAHILRDRNPLVTPAYVNTEIGVSQWLIKELGGRIPRTSRPSTELRTPVRGKPNPEPPYQPPDGGGTGQAESQILIIEMGAYKRGEIKLLCDIVKPTMGVLTFIGGQHIALFGSQEALCQAKAELFDALPEDGHAFLNADCELCTEIASHARCPVTRVGTGGHADIDAYDIEETPTGIRFRASDTTFTVPLHGTHNVVNVLLSLAVARRLGMDHTTIAARLKSFEPPSHTFSVTEHHSVTVLNDTHNSSPASFKAAIAWARSQPQEEKVLLASGLLELGEEQDPVHTDLGAAAAPVFSRTIFLSKRAGAAFQQGFGKPVEAYSKKTEAVGSGVLLCCIGRMSDATIERLLPNERTS